MNSSRNLPDPECSKTCQHNISAQMESYKIFIENEETEKLENNENSLPAIHI